MITLLEKLRNPELFMENSIYYPGCGTNIPNPECSDCPDKELGGIRGIALVKETFSFSDITDIAEWWAGIASGDIYLFPKTRGSLEQTETESQGFGDQSTVVDGYDFVLNVMEPNFVANVDFWNAVKKSNQWRVAWRTETQLWISDDPAGIIPKAPVAEDIKSTVLWNIMFKFSQEDYPTANTIATGLFEQCVDNA